MPTLEDLERAVETAATDMEKIQALNELAQALKVIDTLRALASAEEALCLIGNRSDCLSEKAEAMLSMGHCNCLLSHYPPALMQSQHARLLFEQVGDQQGVAASLNMMGGIYYHLSDYPEALKCYQESLTIRQTIDDKQGIADSMYNIGSVFGTLADYPSAVKYHQESLAIRQAIGDKQGIANSMGVIGTVFTALADYSNALQHYQESLLMFRLIGHQHGIARSLNSIGTVYESLADYTNALKHYQDGLVIHQSFGEKQSIAFSVGNLGSIFIKLHRYDEAETHLMEALALCDEVGLKGQRFQVLELLATLYAETGRFEKAYHIHTQFHKAEKVVFSEESQKQLSTLRVRFETEQAQQEAELRKREAELTQLKNVELANALSDAELQRRRAEEANQFKTELLSIAAHDLKNPLQSVLGFSELIQEKTDNQDIEKYSTHINSAAGRMVSLINRLLESSAAELGRITLTKTPEPIGHLLETVVIENRHHAEKKDQRLVFDIESELVAVVDRERLRDVFENLISNAVKYTAPAKAIAVRAKKTADGQSGNPVIEISIQDEGQGLSADDLQKVFGRFQRLSARPTGGESSTGLGLYIVKQVIELHGGRVWAESDGKGKGSTFFIELPALVA